MESKVKSSFLGEINGIDIKNEAVYDATFAIIEKLEKKKGISITSGQFTKVLEHELADLDFCGYYLQDVTNRTVNSITSNRTFKDFEIKSGEEWIDKDSDFNQMAKDGKFEFVIDQHKTLETHKEEHINQKQPEELLEDIKKMKTKLEADFERTSFQTPKAALHGMMHTIDYGGLEPQHTVINLQTSKVAYIGFESDDTLEKGLARAEHYNQWALESKNLDGHRTGITADTINVTTMSSNPNLQGYLTTGSMGWLNTESLIHTTFPKASAEIATKHIEKINKVTEDLLYDLKADAIVNPHIEDAEIPIKEWTQSRPDGFTQAAKGNLEHVGGYIASMANIKEMDAKKLLSSNQMIQYQEAELQKREHGHVQEQSKPAFKIKIQSKSSKSQDLGR